MAYDTSKDKVISTYTQSDQGGIVLSVHQYNDGEPKLQLVRTYVRDEEISYGKLGRMTSEEVLWLKEQLENVIGDMG